MTSKEKNDIHEDLSAYRFGPAIEKLRRQVPESNSATHEQLAKLAGRHEHFTRASRHDYTPMERRNENDDLVKKLQLLLNRLPVVDKPRTLADILGRPYEEEQDSPGGPNNDHPEDEISPQPMGFSGEIVHEGSPSAKRDSFKVNKSYGATYHVCIQTLRGSNVTIEQGDRTGGRVTGTTTAAAGARTGEYVLLWLMQHGRGTTEVTLIVDSQLPDTVFDFGRHQRLLDRLRHKIQYG